MSEQSIDSLYDDLFHALGNRPDVLSFFSPGAVNQGIALAAKSRFSSVKIVRCSPYGLELSSVRALNGSNRLTCHVLLTVVGKEVSFSVACDCKREHDCEHALSTINLFLSGEWRDDLSEFIAFEDIMPKEASRFEQSWLNQDLIERPLSASFLKRIDSINAVPIGEPVKVQSRSELGLEEGAKFSVGFELQPLDTISGEWRARWKIRALVVEWCHYLKQFTLSDWGSFRDLCAAGLVEFSDSDTQILLGLGGMSVAVSDDSNMQRPSATQRPSSGSKRRQSSALLMQAVASGKCFLAEVATRLRAGPDLKVRLGWCRDKGGARRPAVLDLPKHLELLEAYPDVIYLDHVKSEVGVVNVANSSLSIPSWLSLPWVMKAQESKLIDELRARALPQDGLEDVLSSNLKPLSVKPVVRLSIYPVVSAAWNSRQSIYSLSPKAPMVVDLAPSSRVFYAINLFFRYGEVEVTHDDNSVKLADSSQPGQYYVRDLSYEKKEHQEFLSTGVLRTKDMGYEAFEARVEEAYCASWSSYDHLSATLGIVPKLLECAQRNGWEVDIPAELRPIVFEAKSIEGEIVESDEPGWFDAQLKVEANGEQFDLGKVLVSLIHKIDLNIGWLRYTECQKVVLMDGTRSLELEPTRLHNLLSIVRELSDPEHKEQLVLNRYSAYALENALSDSCGRWQSSEQIKALRKRIAKLDKPTAIAEPEGFKGVLRDYQQHGLAWLSTVGQAELGGILADDMGLGKTIQIIAFMLLEQSKNGANKKPHLVVCPKSVAPNWMAELARFAPALKVHQSVGSGRSKVAEDLLGADVVVTSYPLLQRDIELYKQVEFNLAIFDEAQAIKNPLTLSYHAALAVKARLKLPVSGTPLENNLRDLWAHFNLTMPGFLYSDKTFNRVYRKPIEKEGDDRLRAHLAERIKPFIMRRTKQEVVKDLPPLSEITQVCEFDGDQRDLYETIRQLTTKKVREALASKGAKRSHIEFLDALLKLRQVCCDPRLVKSPTARKVKKSCKLELLMSLVPTLIEDGRSIVLFSQFTSMLVLIEEEVRKLGIPFCVLTGETIDREAPIKDFQSGKKKLFLMSLKAGGVGVNLTAADTVIMYDPWWNPAVEAQAICRAHRIGQKNPVFAYRLVVKGSIEEKILELQQRKRALVENLLSDNERPPELSEELIDYLFSPLEGL